MPNASGFELSTRVASRYVQPLREGGSLPAVVDTDDGLFVAKFRGAGQGPRALVAELIVGLLARALGLPVPELVLIDVPTQFGRTEPDPEIRDLLRASHGLNFGMRYLDGAFNYDALAAGSLIGPSLAAAIVWLDALTTNPDRTHGNPNLLIWRRTPWLIDHGAALYIHHRWPPLDQIDGSAPFAPIREHVLLEVADDLEAADAMLRSRVGSELVDAILGEIPDAWLADTAEPAAAEAARERYRRYLTSRLASRAFVDDAVAAQRERAARPPQRRAARR